MGLLTSPCIAVPCDEEERETINPNMTDQQKKMQLKLMAKFADVFSKQPGCTNAADVCITTGDAFPVHMLPYSGPSMIPGVREEIDKLLAAGIIEQSITVPLHHQ